MKLPTRLFGSLVQAAALAEVIDREARWRNLVAELTADQGGNAAALSSKQRAYKEFREKVSIYNRLYRPAYRDFWPVTTPASLARWCRTIADILCGAGRIECPTALMENAFLRAEKLARRLAVEDIARPLAGESVAEAVAALVEIARWCDGFAATSDARVAA
jgi:hypothetical protein